MLLSMLLEHQKAIARLEERLRRLEAPADDLASTSPPSWR
jgi:hypothetical protein